MKIRLSSRTPVILRNAAYGLAGVLCLLTPVSVRSLAQETQEPPVSGQTLKVTTEVVNVYAVVKDKKGHLIPNLNKEDFEVREDKAPQKILYFSRETDTPLTMGILVDTSPSQEHVLSIEQREAKAFLQQVLRPKDLAFVLHFDLEVELLQDFTASQNLLAKAIDETVINGGGRGPMPSTFPGSSDPCCTKLYDAAYLASTEMMKNEVGRKVLILLTDGEDVGSSVKLERALEAAQKSDVIIYCINISDRMFYIGMGMPFSGESVLKKLADDTGGRVIDVKHERDAHAAFQQIADELRTQYLLGYTPTNTKHDGTFRKIEVRTTNGNYKVQARRGYYAPAD